MLTGLIHPSGSGEVAGQIPSGVKPALRQITLVMGQKQQLIWDLPALDTLKINAAIMAFLTKSIDAVGELTEMLSLQGKLNQPVRKLSLGERMKAELLAALLHQPRCFFGRTDARTRR